MADLETDYLVVGAGVSGMGIVDALVPRAGDVDVIIVDTRHSPGGHWNDAYSFVRLHQPAAVFGAESMRFGEDRIDEHGPNAGFYQLATAPEVVAYYGRLLDAFEARGNARCMDGDEHVLRSLVTGKTTTIAVRRRLVDTTYAEPTIPSRHTPSFGVDADARVAPPNELVNLADAPSGFTVLGAGKTAMDACGWLLGQGVEADAIRWVRPRDVWVLRRAATQPLKLIGTGFMRLQAAWVKAAAQADDAQDMARRMEAADVFARLDTSVEPELFRGATVNDGEIDEMRRIEDVVRMGRVVHVGSNGIKFEQGELPTAPGHVYVDCTASRVRDVPLRPVFEPGRITMQRRHVPSGWRVRYRRQRGSRRAPHFSLRRRSACSIRRWGEWMEGCRLNSARVLPELQDDPVVQAGQATTFEHLGAAMENLARIASK